MHSAARHPRPHRPLNFRLSMHCLLMLLLAAASATAAQHDLPRRIVPHDPTDVHVRAQHLHGVQLRGGVTAGAARQLVHGNLKPWQYPICPRCKLISCTTGVWSGHCKSGGKLFSCTRSKSSVSRISLPPDDVVVELPPDDAEVDAEIVIGDSIEPPLVACSVNVECSLPANQFERVNGSVPISARGQVQARCNVLESSRIEDGGGVCMCTYMVAATSGATDDEALAVAEASTTEAADSALVAEAEVESDKKGNGKGPGGSKQDDGRDRVEAFCVLKARSVAGPDDRNAGRYVHEEHADSGTADVRVGGDPAQPSLEGPDLTGVTVTNANVGQALEVFSLDYELIEDVPDEPELQPVPEPVPEPEPEPAPPSKPGRGRERNR
eukprot:jgi/Ulvmu1/8606/UM046_0004.1